MSTASMTTVAPIPASAVAVQSPPRDLLTGSEWTSAQIRELYHLAADIKARPERYRGALSGRFLALIFEKPSLRTRVTFEVGISSMGGAAVFLDHTQSRLGERESVADVAKNLDRWVQGIVARVFEQRVLSDLADNASIPIINALSERFHPCQALADFFTLEEHFGSLRGLKFAYVGDGNNVCNSLITIGARVGAHVRIATPAGYEPDPAIVAEARRFARETRGKIEIFRSPEDAVTGAQTVYTDVWASMGQEDEAAAREAIFGSYQVNESLFAQTDPRAVFMHCLPAHRGSEVTEGVLDSPQSIVFDQAENRLHVQKAILLTLLG
jgi:ornithine carbamoyltransferase